MHCEAILKQTHLSHTCLPPSQKRGGGVGGGDAQNRGRQMWESAANGVSARRVGSKVVGSYCGCSWYDYHMQLQLLQMQVALVRLQSSQPVLGGSRPSRFGTSTACKSRRIARLLLSQPTAKYAGSMIQLAAQLS